MMIGFTSRGQTVSEGDAPPGIDIFPIQIHVATRRTSERPYFVIFRFLETSSEAVVVPQTEQSNLNYDAIFGSRLSPDDPIQISLILGAGEDQIQPLVTEIRNDLRPEFQECYTITILQTDYPGIKEGFYCNVPGYMGFFCAHTICIDDDDGKNM